MSKKTKERIIRGSWYDAKTMTMHPCEVQVLTTNDIVGRTLSLAVGAIMFSVPFDEIWKDYLESNKYRGKR